MFKILTIFFFLVSSVAFSQPEKETIVWESFERRNEWQNTGWKNTIRTNLSLSSKYHSHKKKALKIEFLEKEFEWASKVAIYKNSNLDLSDANLILDVYNRSFYKLEVAIGFNTGKDFVYFESIARPIKKGWNKNITFSIDAHDFKSEQTGWEYFSELKNKDDIRMIVILIYSPKHLRKAAIYLDNIRLEAK